MRPHPTFKRVGDDIELDLPITIDEAVLGDYQLDVWRLAVSVVLVARENGFGVADQGVVLNIGKVVAAADAAALAADPGLLNHYLGL